MNFQNLWLDYVAYRVEIGKPLTPTGAKLVLEQLRTLGQERAKAAIRHSIRNRWVDIYEPASKSSRQRPKSQCSKRSEVDERRPVVENPPTPEEFKAHCESKGICFNDGKYLWNHWKDNGWTRGGRPIYDWQAAIRAWQSAGHLPSARANPK
jgi:hypothetical protein